YPPLHALARRLPAGVRRDVRARRLGQPARRPARREAARAGLDRALSGGDGVDPAADAARSVEDRPGGRLERARGDRDDQVPRRAGDARRDRPRGAAARLARLLERPAARGDAPLGARRALLRRPRRGAQGDGGAARPPALPAGERADRARADAAGARAREVRRAARAGAKRRVSGPLEDVRILDLTRLLPGGVATALLADLGASVVKIEQPGLGDYMRWSEPLLGPESAASWVTDRNKRSVALDLKQPGGVAALKRLAERADALIESFRPGVVDRLGVGYDDLRAVNPRLVYCSLTGYGQDGPLAAVAGHDLNYIGRAGVLGITGEPDGPPTIPG